MQARRASRELAFILLSQFDKKIINYSKESLDDIILKSVRILSDSARNDLKLSLGSLIDMKNRIDDYEAEHEINLNRPMEAANIPVPLPMTSDLSGRVEEMIDIADKALLALEIAEFTTLESQNEVKDYAIRIAETFQQNHKEIDEIELKNIESNYDILSIMKMKNKEYSNKFLEEFITKSQEHLYIDGIISCPYTEKNVIKDILILVKKMN